MPNRLEGLSETVKWRLMTDAAKRGAETAGYTLERVPGRGLSNIWSVTKNGETQRASIRTTRDRWFAFPPLAGGTKWKTLDDVDLVIVATVDSREEPQNVEVYIFPAAEVKDRFNHAYAARTAGGQILKDNFGMWVSLDKDNRELPVSIGSGIIDIYKRIAKFSIEDLLSSSSTSSSTSDEDEDDVEALTSVEQTSPQPTTISEVMAWARQKVADLAGVKVEAVKLELKVEY